MELDIQEKMVKYRDAKQAQAAKNTSIATSSAIDKGKSPMEEIPQASVDQQVEAYLHTSEQIKQKLRGMTSASGTQEITTSQPIEATQVTTVVEKSQSKQTQIEEKPLKKLKDQVSSIPASTIDLTNSEEEDERISPVPVTVEVGNGNGLQEFTNLFNGSNERSSYYLP